MKVTIKTVTNVKFDLEIDSSMKVLGSYGRHTSLCHPMHMPEVSDMKAKIEAQEGPAFPKEGMTLVFRGKVLADTDSVEEAQITENSFMVVMVKKGPPKAAVVAPVPATPAAPPADAAATPAAPAPAPAATPTSAAAPSTDTPASAAPAASPASSILVGAELQSSIAAIMEMGFAKEEVERAMRAAFNNPERAVEYLMNGIPESAVEAAAPPAAPAGAAAAAPAGTAAARAGPGGPNAAPLDLFGGGGAAAQAPGEATGPMAALRNNPQFAQIRAMIQQDPASLPRMLAELSSQNPALMQILQQNQAEFLRMMMEQPGGAEGGGSADEALQELMAQRGMEMPTIELTEEDDQAIRRLQEMGFPREACISAYFACDKQEELAANLLLEGGIMDEG